MGLKFKFNPLAKLKENGYTTYSLRKNSILSESTIQKLRKSNPVSWENIESLCHLLRCQPGDILEYIPDEPVEEIPEQETQSATLTPSFRVDSMDYPTGMLDSPSLDELRKRRDAIADKRNAAKERRDAFRAEMSQKEEQPMNNIGELFAKLGAEQISKEQSEQSEGEPQNS